MPLSTKMIVVYVLVLFSMLFSGNIIAEDQEWDGDLRKAMNRTEADVIVILKRLMPELSDDDINRLINQHRWKGFTIPDNETALVTITPAYYKAALESIRKSNPEFGRQLILRLPAGSAKIGDTEVLYFPPSLAQKAWRSYSNPGSTLDLMDSKEFRKRDDLAFQDDYEGLVQFVVTNVDGLACITILSIHQTAEYSLCMVMRKVSLDWTQVGRSLVRDPIIPDLPGFRKSRRSSLYRSTPPELVKLVDAQRKDQAANLAINESDWMVTEDLSWLAYGAGNLDILSTYGDHQWHAAETVFSLDPLLNEMGHYSIQNEILRLSQSPQTQEEIDKQSRIRMETKAHLSVRRDFSRALLGIPEQQEAAEDGVFAITILEATDDRIRLSWASDAAHHDWMVRVRIDQGELYIPDLKGNELIILQDKDKKSEKVTATFYLIKPDFTMALTHKVRFDYRLNK